MFPRLELEVEARRASRRPVDERRRYVVSPETTIALVLRLTEPSTPSPSFLALPFFARQNRPRCPGRHVCCFGQPARPPSSTGMPRTRHSGSLSRRHAGGPTSRLHLSLTILASRNHQT